MNRLMMLAALAAVACDDKADDSGITDDSFTDTDVAEALWTEIDGYSSWDQVDPWVGVQASADGTHGDYVQIWVNPTAYTNITAASGADMPAGSIIVKEGYDTEDGAARTVAVMKKVSGYAPDNGDWFWARFDPDGSVAQAGEVSGCYGCHGSGQDYVLFTTW